MAFDKTKLTRISAGPLQVWAYTTNDTHATVIADDYFLDADIQPAINVNDLILASTDMDGTPGVALLVVTASDSANLNTSDNITST